MDREFSRKEFYDLVWSKPMQTLASSLGVSDVALAKRCKKFDIPVPPRGYWARIQAGKPATRILLPPRFPGAADRVGGDDHRYGFYGEDWAKKFQAVEVPPVPTFDEEIEQVRDRAAKIVGKVRCSNKFDQVHPQVAKLLAHDEERRQEYSKYSSSYYAPRYDSGIERRRLLIINALFMAPARIGYRPSMSTSKYGQDANSERDIALSVGNNHTYVNIEPIKLPKEAKEHLRLSLGFARERKTASRFWQDDEQGRLEDKLTDILVDLLVHAEQSYRDSLVRHREWVIERKAAAEKELLERKKKAEAAERARLEQEAKERIERLLREAEGMSRAAKIRTYADSVLDRASELSLPLQEVERWVAWARNEADRIDPLKNGTVARSVKELSEGN